MPAHAVGPEFVGRVDELAALQQALRTMLAGHGQVALFAGEPGIGKTRLAEEFAAGAALAGARVLWGRCYEGEGAPAFWPWIEAIRAYVRGHDPAELRTQLGDGLAEIAQIVPEVGFSDAPGAEHPPLVHGRPNAPELDAVAEFLVRVSEVQPLVIVLDDLHWADSPSLLLFEFVARQAERARLLLVGTYRDLDVTSNSPLAGTIGKLIRLPNLVRLPLEGLTEADVELLIGGLAGPAAKTEFMASVNQATEGNPLFVNEIVRYLAHEPGRHADVPTGPQGLRVPPSIQAMIGLRLASLSDRCRRLLEIAAVLGREFSLRALAQVSAEPPQQLLAPLEQAEGARLIAISDTLGSYRFSHTLVRETLYSALPYTRRLRLHHEVGTVLAGLWGDEPAHLAELAWHFTRSAPVGNAGRAVTYARKAGDHALKLLAYEEGVRCYQLALDALALDGDTSGLPQCELLLSLGEAYILSGDISAGHDAFWRAVELVRALTSVRSQTAEATLLARAALAISRLTLSVQLPDPRLQALLAEALDAIGDADSPLRVQVLGQMASDLAFAGETARRTLLSNEAVAIARRLGDPGALAVALLAQHNALRGPGGQEEQLVTATEALRLAEAAGDGSLVLLARRLRVVDFTEMGDFPAFERERRSHAELAKRLRDPYHLWLAALWQAMQAQMAGRWQHASEHAEEALVLGQRAETDLAQLYHAFQLAAIRRESGPIGSAVAAFQAIPAGYPALDGLGAVLAGLYVDAGMPDAAWVAYEQALSTEPRPPDNRDSGSSLDIARRRRSGHWLLTTAHFSAVAAALGDTPRAAALFAMLEPLADRVVMVSPGAVCDGPVSFYLGLLASALRRATQAVTITDGAAVVLPSWADAARYFEAAIALSTRIGADVWVARIQVAYASLLQERAADELERDRFPAARAGWEAQSQALLRQADSAAEQLGLTQIGASIERLRRQPVVSAKSGTGRRVFPDALTAREIDVLRLLVVGASNKQIAATLFLSVATVRSHTISIYSKTSTSGRAGAVAYALQHDLMPP